MAVSPYERDCLAETISGTGHGVCQCRSKSAGVRRVKCALFLRNLLVGHVYCRRLSHQRRHHHVHSL